MCVEGKINSVHLWILLGSHFTALMFFWFSLPLRVHFLCVEDNNHEKCLSSECILLPGIKSQRLRSRNYHMMNNLVTKFSIFFCWGYLEGNMSSLIFIPYTNVFKKPSQNIQTLAWSWTVTINTGQIPYWFCFPLRMRYEGISHTYTEEKTKIWTDCH